MADLIKNFPLKIEIVEESVAKEIRKYYTGERSGFVRVGPHGYFFSEKYLTEGPRIYNMPLRSDDILVATYPRSGTTWTQEIVWLILNNLDYQKSAEILLVNRYTFVEYSILLDDEFIEELKDLHKNTQSKLKVVNKIATPGVDLLAATPSPRFIKTHLPYSLLPPTTLDTCKTVYVARDPRDVVVSFYHHNRLLKNKGYVGDFKTYWKHFVNNMYIYTPFFPHLKEAWKLRNHPNMLFLFYEELKKDLPGVIERICKFFGKQYSAEQIAGLCDHVSIDNFKKNKSCNMGFLTQELELNVPGEESFVRKGKIGGWRDYFDEEMTKEADEWIAENLKDTDLRFP